MGRVVYVTQLVAARMRDQRGDGLWRAGASDAELAPAVASAWGLAPGADGAEPGAAADDAPAAADGRAGSEEPGAAPPAANGGPARDGGGAAKSAPPADPDNSDDETAQVRRAAAGPLHRYRPVPGARPLGVRAGRGAPPASRMIGAFQTPMRGLRGQRARARASAPTALCPRARRTAGGWRCGAPRASAARGCARCGAPTRTASRARSRTPRPPWPTGVRPSPQQLKKDCSAVRS